MVVRKTVKKKIQWKIYWLFSVVMHNGRTILFRSFTCGSKKKKALAVAKYQYNSHYRLLSTVNRICPLEMLSSSKAISFANNKNDLEISYCRNRNINRIINSYNIKVLKAQKTASLNVISWNVIPWKVTMMKNLIRAYWTLMEKTMV